jgi:hypothetical protein
VGLQPIHTDRLLEPPTSMRKYLLPGQITRYGPEYAGARGGQHPPLLKYTNLALCRGRPGGLDVTSAYVRGWHVTGGSDEANLSLKSSGGASTVGASSPSNTRGCPKTASPEEMPLISLAPT